MRDGRKIRNRRAPGRCAQAPAPLLDEFIALLAPLRDYLDPGLRLLDVSGFSPAAGDSPVPPRSPDSGADAGRGSSLPRRFRMHTRRLRVSPRCPGPHTSRISCVCMTIMSAVPGHALQHPELQGASGAPARRGPWPRAGADPRHGTGKVKPRRLVIGAHIAPQRRAHPRQQFRRAEGLGDVVIGTGIEGRDLLFFHGARGQHDDGHRRPAAHTAG